MGKVVLGGIQFSPEYVEKFLPHREVFSALADPKRLFEASEGNPVAPPPRPSPVLPGAEPGRKKIGRLMQILSPTAAVLCLCIASGSALQTLASLTTNPASLQPVVAFLCTRWAIIPSPGLSLMLVFAGFSSWLLFHKQTHGNAVRHFLLFAGSFALLLIFILFAVILALCQTS